MKETKGGELRMVKFWMKGGQTSHIVKLYGRSATLERGILGRLKRGREGSGVKNEKLKRRNSSVLGAVLGERQPTFQG